LPAVEKIREFAFIAPEELFSGGPGIAAPPGQRKRPGGTMPPGLSDSPEGLEV